MAYSYIDSILAAAELLREELWDSSSARGSIDEIKRDLHARAQADGIDIRTLAWRLIAAISSHEAGLNEGQVQHGRSFDPPAVVDSRDADFFLACARIIREDAELGAVSSGMAAIDDLVEGVYEGAKAVGVPASAMAVHLIAALAITPRESPADEEQPRTTIQ
jgi:hypothetical protein